jgi:KDO2-lipid IV(A) lauroyltransferase
MPEKTTRSIWASAKHVLEYAALRTLAQLLRIVGIDAASGLMGWIWQTIGPRTARQQRVTGNLRLAFPDMGAEDLAEISRLQWNNLGRTFAESFMIDRFIDEPDRIEFHQDDMVGQIAKSGKGFVFVSLHTANWELISIPVAEHLEITGLYQKLSNDKADRYLREMREMAYRGGLLPKSVRTPGTVMKIVRAGNGVAMLADQREKKGVEVEFFGQATRANPFPAMIARRLDVPLIAGRTIRLSGARFRVEAQELPVPRTEDMNADIQAAAEAIQNRFETWIREYPGQWMWVHDRWRPGRPRRRHSIQALDKSDPNAN